ncbi:MAG: hypothetical protein WAU59_18270 [Rhodoplanes sp.]
MVIASRTLKWQTETGVVDVPILILAPERAAEGSWACRYEIDWPDGKWIMRALGVDAVQAILSALQMIGAEIYTSDYHKSGSLFFESPGLGYGFPVPASLRHLLQGDDLD